MPKPEVIGRPHKISVRISWTNAEGTKHSKSFEVHGLAPEVAETAVRRVLTEHAGKSTGEGS